MIATNLTPTIASFLLYISKGETPHDAVELACIDVWKTSLIEKQFNDAVLMAKFEIFRFLHPEISSRIKHAAWLLTFWFLKFEALKDGELEEIENYINSLNSYFK